MKKWYQSKTIGGILISVIGAACLYFGINTGVEIPANADVAQVQAVIAQIKAANGSFPAILGIVLSSIGSLWALYGRIKAETIISSAK